MSRLTARLAMVLLTAGLAACAPAPAASAATGPQQAELTRLAHQLVDAGAPGVIVRVDDGSGHPVEIVAQPDWAARDQRLEATDEFRMGSNTKTMVAVVVLQLVAEGKLRLDDPVERWLPGAVPNGAAITLHMLLDHSSGLYDYSQDPALRPSVLGAGDHGWTSTQLAEIGVAHPPLFAPGAGWAYSNTDYAVLGAVLERATGTGLADLVRDRIAAPLGLDHTYLATDGTWRGRYAHGYEPDPEHMPSGVPAEFREVAGPRRDGHVDVSGNDPTWGGAAGGVVSTAQDWARFCTALMAGQLLPQAQLDEMLTTIPQDPADPDGPRAGLGIMTGTTPCGTVWTHDGGITGYLSVTLTDRTGQRTATVLVPTELITEFDVEPQFAAASRNLSTAVICAMFGRPAQTG